MKRKLGELFSPSPDPSGTDAHVTICAPRAVRFRDLVQLIAELGGIIAFTVSGRESGALMRAIDIQTSLPLFNVSFFSVPEGCVEQEASAG